MVFSRNVPQTLGVGTVQQQLATLFELGSFQKIVPNVNSNPFIEVAEPKYTLDPVTHYILNFISPNQKTFKDKLSDLGFDDERFYEILVPFETPVAVGDQFLLSVNGTTMKMIIVDYKTDLSGLINMSCKDLPEFILD
jgi:hypothetical protein